MGEGASCSSRASTFLAKEFISRASAASQTAHANLAQDGMFGYERGGDDNLKAAPGEYIVGLKQHVHIRAHAVTGQHAGLFFMAGIRRKACGRRTGSRPMNTVRAKPPATARAQAAARRSRQDQWRFQRRPVQSRKSRRFSRAAVGLK